MKKENVATKLDPKKVLDVTVKVLCGIVLVISGFSMHAPTYFTVLNCTSGLFFSLIYAITYEQEHFTFDFGEFLRATTICGTALCLGSLVVEHDTSAMLSLLAGGYLVVTIPNKNGKRWLNR